MICCHTYLCHKVDDEKTLAKPTQTPCMRENQCNLTYQRLPQVSWIFCSLNQDSRTSNPKTSNPRTKDPGSKSIKMSENKWQQ